MQLLRDSRADQAGVNDWRTGLLWWRVQVCDLSSKYFPRRDSRRPERRCTMGLADEFGEISARDRSVLSAKILMRLFPNRSGSCLQHPIVRREVGPAAHAHDEIDALRPEPSKVSLDSELVWRQWDVLLSRRCSSPITSFLLSIKLSTRRKYGCETLFGKCDG